MYSKDPYPYDRCDLPEYTPQQIAAAIRNAYCWIGRTPMNDVQNENAALAKATLGPVLYFLEHS